MSKNIDHEVMMALASYIIDEIGPKFTNEVGEMLGKDGIEYAITIVIQYISNTIVIIGIDNNAIKVAIPNESTASMYHVNIADPESCDNVIQKIKDACDGYVRNFRG